MVNGKFYAMCIKKKLKSKFLSYPYTLYLAQSLISSFGMLSRAEFSMFFWIFMVVANEIDLKKQPNITRGQISRECFVQKSCLATNWYNCGAQKQMLTCVTTTKCLQFHSWNKCFLSQEPTTRPWLGPRGQRARALSWRASQSYMQNLILWFSRWHPMPTGFTPSETLELEVLPLQLCKPEHGP